MLAVYVFQPLYTAQTIQVNTFAVWVCLWLDQPQALCSYTTCAPVKEARLTSMLSVQLMKHVCVFIYDAVVSAVMISQARREDIQTQWKSRCVGALQQRLLRAYFRPTASPLQRGQECVHSQIHSREHLKVGWTVWGEIARVSFPGHQTSTIWKWVSAYPNVGLILTMRSVKWGWCSYTCNRSNDWCILLYLLRRQSLNSMSSARDVPHFCIAWVCPWHTSKMVAQ